MKYISIKIILIVTTTFIVGCWFKSTQEPSMDGLAHIFKKNDSYCAIYPRTYQLPFYFGCRVKNQEVNNQITIDEKLIGEKENIFRNKYYELLVGYANNLHPDSAAYVVEFPGEYMLVKEVSHKELIHKKQKDFDKTIAWNRQYLGFLNSKKDTVIVINMSDPDMFDTYELGAGWISATDGALDHFSIVAFNLRDSSVTSEYCKAINQ